MFRLYSKGCEYGLRALIFMAANTEPQKSLLIKQICRKAGIPEHFTRKVFQALVRARLLTAVPGPGGGYQFRKKPDLISVSAVIKAIDGPDSFQGCLLGKKNCPTKPCALHAHVVRAKTEILKNLETLTVSDLAARTAD